MNLDQITPAPTTPTRPYPTVMILAVLLILGGALTVYYLNRPKVSPGAPPATAQNQSSPAPSASTFTIKNQVLSLKDGILTIKNGDQEVRVKTLPEDMAVKQFKIGESGIGTKPDKINPGDFVSLTVAKNADGQLYMTSAVILLEK